MAGIYPLRLLGYHLSVAIWVGIFALLGVVMKTGELRASPIQRSLYEKE